MTEEAFWLGPGEQSIVSGVVHPRDAGGVKIGNEETWTLRFAFETWRDANGVLYNRELVIHRRVTKEELRAYMSQIKPLEVFSVKVIFTGPTSAELLDILSKIEDPADSLVQRAAELSKPVTREHKRFGTLTLERRLGEWLGTASWQGKAIRLHLSAGDDTELEAALQTAIMLWDDQGGWSKRIQDYAIEQLLDLKNNYWLDDDEAPLTPDDFVSRMTLEAMTVSADDHFDFWHNDGALFLGHAIQVSGNLRDGPTRADIPG